MKKLLTLLFIVITFNTFGQTPTYLDSIYPIQVQTNIQYGKAKNITVRGGTGVRLKIEQ